MVRVKCLFLKKYYRGRFQQRILISRTGVGGANRGKRGFFFDLFLFKRAICVLKTSGKIINGPNVMKRRAARAIYIKHDV